jgi:RHS repeat-associated protein
MSTRKLAAALGLAAVLMLMVSAAGVTAETVKAATAAESTSPELGPLTSDGREILNLRTRTSQTFRTEEGLLKSILRPHSVHFRGEDGRWQPIDNTLRRTPTGSFTNTANAYRVELPGQLGQPVEVRHDDAWVQYALIGASASSSPSVEGATATYREALPETSLSYTAHFDSVREDIILHSDAAPTSFAFSVVTSAGLQPRLLRDGAVVLADEGGRTRFRFGAPFMRDRSGEISTDLTVRVLPSASGFVLTLTPDPRWLADPERAYPVTIDPDLLTGTSACHITSGAAQNQSFCGTTFDVGYDGSKISRGLLYFDLGGNDSSWELLFAELKLGLQSASGQSAASVSAHALTRDWYWPTTWIDAQSGVPWTTPGGDYEPAPADTNESVGPGPGTYSWYVTEQAERWVYGQSPNFGFLIKRTTEDSTNLLRFQDPQLVLTWADRTGIRPHYKFEGDELTDRMSIAANVGARNMMINSLDLQLAGTGMDLVLSRHYNSLGTGVWGANGAFGGAWVLNTGQDVKLVPLADGAMAFYGPTRFVVSFLRKADGSFRSPSGIGATLVKNPDATYTLTWHADGQKWQFSSAGRLESQVDANGNRISLAYTNGRLTSITDTKGRVTTITYNASNLISTITDPAGRVNQYGYSGTSLVSHTDPAGKVTSFGTLHGQMKITDAKGNVTHFDIGTANPPCSSQNLVGWVRPSDPAQPYVGTITCLNYDLRRTVVTDPRDYETTHHYDASSRVTKTVDPLGNEVSTSYTSDSNVETYTAGTGGIAENGYDANHSLTSSRLATGATSRWEYDDPLHKFYVTKATDPQGNWLKYAYDTLGNVKSIENPTTTNKAELTYNANGTVATAKDFNGILTSYGYVNGDLTSVNNPAPLGDIAYTHDSISRIASETDGRGQTTSFEYDQLDRLTKITYQGGQAISYVYDAIGNLTSMTDNTGTTTYEYDAWSRLTKETLPGSKVSTYTYDAAGNLLSVTTGGQVRDFAYNAVNLVWRSGNLSQDYTTYVYDADHLRTETRYPGGVTMYMRYDDANRLVEVEAKKPASGTVLTKFTYDYRLSGQDTGLRQSVTDKDGNKTAYTYDGLNRLTIAEERSAAGALLNRYAYSYDANSNRTSQIVNGQTTSYAYNDADQLTQAGPTTFSYDLNGNEDWNSAGRDFAYNAKDQVVSATPPGGASIAMSYTGPGQFERVSAGPASFWDNALGLTRETTAGQTTSFHRDDGGLLLSWGDPAGNYHFPLYDGLGSVAAVTDRYGTVVATYKYDPFGKLVASTGTLQNPYRFLGGLGVYFDSATGLYKMGTRYYDPALGRFTQVDPTEGGSANAYDYADQDPVNKVDPNGDIGIAVVAVAVGARLAAPVAARFAVRQAHRIIGRKAAGRVTTPVIRGLQARVGAHPAQHGLPPHLQLNWWRVGVKGKPRAVRWDARTGRRISSGR